MHFLMAIDNNHEASAQIKVGYGRNHQIDDFFSSDSKSQAYDFIICSDHLFSKVHPGFSCPFFVISDAAEDKWTPLLEAGADGVLFDGTPIDGMMSQIFAFLRRYQRKTQIIPQLGIEIDFERTRVYAEGNSLDLTLMEFKIMRELARKGSQVVARHTIQKEILNKTETGRSLDVHICSLRKKIKPYGLYIESIRGVGYRLMPGRESISFFPDEPTVRGAVEALP
jgi:DNA-binding winged helix-turn-helix (wHTH) protein